MVSIVTTSVGKALASAAAKKFGASVVERWTRHRAEQFFDSFVEACGVDLTNSTQAKRSEALVDDMLKDDTKSEALFDAYRRVCFSKSKTLGPRIIGLLTGKLVHENRMATDQEECVFAAAELLSDAELYEFMKEYHQHRTKAKGVKDQKAEHYMVGDAVYIRWCEENDGMLGTSEFDIGPFPWDEAFGRWAVNLNQCGLMSARVQQNIKQVGIPNVEGRSTSTKVVTTVSFSSGCVLLYDILARGLRSDSSA